MIALLTALAFGQGGVENAIRANCDGFLPVAGTAGFNNGLSAIRTNAQTYGAGEFSRRRMRGKTYMAIDYRMVLGLARVPTQCIDSEAKRYGTVYNQPLDVGATNLGLNVPFFEDETDLNLSFRLFYASSVTTSTMGSRVFTLALPMFNLYPATFAPLIGTSTSGGSLSTFAVDWIGGGTFKSDIVSIQAGYTGTRGLYLDVTQEKIAIFVNTALQGDFNLSDASYFLGGVQHFDPLNLGATGDTLEKFGMTSLFYRNLPQTDSQNTGPIADIRSRIDKLKTGHLRQEDMFEMVDFRAAWQFGQQSRIREIAAAAHTPNWHPRKELDHDTEDGAGYVRAGIVNLPDQPLFGVVGGIRPTLRAVYKKSSGEGWGIEVAAQMNDPDLLDLYPFGYNAFGISAELSLNGDDF